MKKSPLEPVVFLPAGAAINVGNQPMKTPQTKYNKEEMIFNREALQKVTQARGILKDDATSRTNRIR